MDDALTFLAGVALLAALFWLCVEWHRKRRIDSFEREMRELLDRNFGKDDR